MYDNSLLAQLQRAIAADYVLIYLEGWDEGGMSEALRQVAATLPESPQVLEWSIAEGMTGALADSDSFVMLSEIGRRSEPALILLKDFPLLLRDDRRLLRAVRDLAHRLRGRRIHLFLSYPELLLPESLKRDIFLCHQPLPRQPELEQMVRQRLPALAQDQTHAIALAMMGLSVDQADHLLRRIAPLASDEAGRILAEIQDEKAQLMRKESCLEFIPQMPGLDSVGGLDQLKTWVDRRKVLFTQRAWEQGVPLPNGILFMGVSGCGKSLAAKAIAAAWGVQLARLDMNLVLSGSYGSPEVAFAKAVQVAEEIAPVVLWIDELENAFGHDVQGPQGGRATILASFLTWMQEKPAAVFLAATANRIQALPAELLRKGRFDQLFFLDLPGKAERVEIFRVHIGRQGGDVAHFDLNYMAAATKGWSGAEIEQAVKSARIDAFQEQRQFDQRDIARAAAKMVPLSQTMKEQIKAIKDWAFGRAVAASSAAGAD